MKCAGVNLGALPLECITLRSIQALNRGPIGIRSTRLNCILQDLYRDTHSTIFGSPKDVILACLFRQ